MQKTRLCSQMVRRWEQQWEWMQNRQVGVVDKAKVRNRGLERVGRAWPAVLSIQVCQESHEREN